MKYRAILILVVISLIFLVSVVPAKAADSVWTWDSSQPPVTYLNGSPVISGGNPNGAVQGEEIPGTIHDWDQRVFIQMNVDSAGTITGWEYDAIGPSSRDGFFYSVEVFNNVDENIYSMSSLTTGGGVWHTFDASGLSVAVDSGYYIQFFAGDFSSVELGVGDEYYIDNVTISGTASFGPGGGTIGGALQPIEELLQVEVNTPRNNSGIVNGASRIIANTSTTISGSTPVYASISGTIDNVTPNSIELTGEIDGEEWQVLYGNLQTVYVQPGDQIDAGCIIAFAGPATTQTTESESTDLKGLVFRIINIDAEGYEDWETFSSPSGTRICGSLAQGDSCLNANPYLNNNADAWNFTASQTGAMPQRGNNRVVLTNKQSMFQYSALDAGETYYITLGLKMLEVPVGGRSALLVIDLGDSFESLSIEVDAPGDIFPDENGVGFNEEMVFILGPFEPTTPDLFPDLFKLSIRNSSTNSQVEVNYVCIGGDASAPIAPYPSCYFNKLGDLSTTGEVLKDSFGTEFIALDDTETITYENLVLSGYDDADATYHVEVVLNASDEDSSSAAATTSPNLMLSYNDGIEYAIEDVFAIPYYVRQFKMVTFTIEVPATETVTADLVITHDQQASTDSEFIYVSNVCLTAPSGWPGYDSSPDSGGGGNGGNGSGSGTCAPIVAPMNTDVWAWIVWLFESLSQFFKCVLPKEIQKLLTELAKITESIASFGLWLLAAIQLIAKWLFSLFGWLVLQLANALITILSAIWNALISIPLFMQLFDLYALLELLIDGVSSVLLAGLNLILTGFKTLGTFAQIILAFWSSLQTAINDPTVASTGLPNCNTILESDPFYPTCLTIDLLSYIIAAFPSTQFSIGAAGAFLAIYTMIKTISWYRDSFAEVS